MVRYDAMNGTTRRNRKPLIIMQQDRLSSLIVSLIHRPKSLSLSLSAQRLLPTTATSIALSFLFIYVEA